MGIKRKAHDKDDSSHMCGGSHCVAGYTQKHEKCSAERVGLLCVDKERLCGLEFPYANTFITM